MSNDKKDPTISPPTQEEYNGMYRLLAAMAMHAEGSKVIPLTKKGKILEDYDIHHSPLTAEFASWFGFLKYDIGLVNKDTIVHIKIVYARPNGERQQILTERLISDMLCESVYSDDGE